MNCWNEIMMVVARLGERDIRHINLSPYSEKEDIQDFFSAFEHAMELHRVNEAEWPAQCRLKVLTEKP